MDIDALLHLNNRRDTTVEDRRIIFYSCRTAMVNGAVRPGIQEEWTMMSRKLAPLLDNQDEEDHLAIIKDNAHILFGTGLSRRRKNKYKWD
jgi:hypothetical protein